jgi:DNA-binding MarR family transcriptional regulator
MAFSFFLVLLSITGFDANVNADSMTYTTETVDWYDASMLFEITASTATEIPLEYTISTATNEIIGEYGNFTRTRDVSNINNAPTITSFEPDLFTVYMHTNVTKAFYVNATDANNDFLSYYWKFDGINYTFNSSQNFCFISADYSMIGNHVLKTRISDGKNETALYWNIVVERDPMNWYVYSSKRNVSVGETVEIVANTTIAGFSGQLIFEIYDNTNNLIKSEKVNISQYGVTQTYWNTTNCSTGTYLVTVIYNETIYKTILLNVYNLLVPTQPETKITVSKISLPTNITEGEAYSIYAKLQNNGNASDIVNVTLEVNGAPIEIKNNVVVNSNASEIIAFSWTAEGDNFTVGVGVMHTDTGFVKRYVLGTVNGSIGTYEILPMVGGVGWPGGSSIDNTSVIPTIILVEPRNYLPIFIHIPDILRTNASEMFTYRISATNADGDPITYRLNTSLLSIDSTGCIYGKISTPGEYIITVIANDTKGETATTFTLIVDDAAIAPLPKGSGDFVLDKFSFILFGLVAICLTSTALIVVFTEAGMYWFFSLFIPLYAKIKKENMLDNFLRGQIYGFIRAKPGAHYKLIRRELKVSNGTLAHHLYILEREGFTTHKSDKLKKMFYPTEYSQKFLKDMNIEYKFPKGDEEEGGIKFSPLQENIIKIIKENPGLSQSDIAKKTKLARQVVRYNLKKLCEQEVISESKGTWKSKYYAANKI